MAAQDGIHRIPLELKLTVVPDSSTAKVDEEPWGPEVILWPMRSAAAMMSGATSLFGYPLGKDMIGALKPAYNLVSDWTNAVETARRGN